ncbi:phospho-sugar mutase [Garciella nitratireducens]|uniref:Phosphoglucomutase n=1 Tax=Garciella nitratireducens DSM 15102 TaxID=1121911 RepID=A0A1T4LTR8_9FIRM|nr:phospho-sugar mutase [Garciella nitratireducens]RBP38708.1 phosphoglucomutase [Garciella nitratireducens]SJZ58047.1 phosphoglucomutase [Garciella nitratireducens DSM 15102]
MDYMEKYHQWLKDKAIDEKTKEELREIEGDIKEIEDRFYKDLEFGTGGLRGIIGAGSNRMNRYTVGKATQGLASYIKKLGSDKKKKGVVIAHDSRNFSREFAQEAALVLNGNGIQTFLFEDLRSTPQLSFTVRYLGCAAGIVITASHNPPQYNGYKVYAAEGMQLGLKESEQVIEEVKKIQDFSSIQKIEKEEAIEKGLFNILDKKIDDAFIEAVKRQSIRRDVIKKVSSDFTIVYTPLHGTGNKPVQRVLKEVGFKKVFIVPEQAQPNGAFPTVEYPNPEDKKAFQLALELAKEKGAHLIIATDPDCDRVGIGFKNKKGEYDFLNGNQTGSLLCHYILSSKKEKGSLPINGAIVKTIVTSELGAEVAKSYGIKAFNTLTGFKFIGEKMEEFQNTGTHEFILGYEESYGYLIGTHARDKDGVVASMMISEMAAYYYDQGKTLDQVLDSLYQEYGYHYEDLKSITLEGKEGMEKIQEILRYFRENAPTSWNGKKVLYLEDYLEQKQYNLLRKVVKPLKFPKSDVLKFILEDHSWFCMRPSGTEPKIKFYFSVIGDNAEKTRMMAHNLIGEVMKTVESI